MFMANLEKYSGAMKLANQIALFVILGSIVLSIFWIVGETLWGHFKHKPDQVTVKTQLADESQKKEISLRIGEVLKIESTNLYVAKIEEQTDSYDSNYRYPYRASSLITRNALITSENSDTTRLLFDSYQNKIDSFQTYPNQEKPEVIVCVYVKNYKASSPEDQEKKSIMLLNLNGDKKKSIVEDVDKILKIEKTLIHLIYTY